MKRWAVMLAATGLVLTLAGTRRPDLVVHPRGEYTWGRVWEGDVVTGRFEVRNRGRAVVRLQARPTGCSCRRVSPAALALPPGGVAAVVVEMAATPGRSRATVTFDRLPQGPPVVLTLRGGVRPALTASVPAVDFGRFPFQRAPTCAVTVVDQRPAGGGPWRVGTTGPQVVVEELPAAHADRFDSVVAVLHPLLGELHETVTVIREGPPRVRLRLPVKGFVTSPYRLLDDALMVGFVRQGTAARASVAVAGLRQPAAVRVWSDLPGATVVVRPGTRPGSASIELTVARVTGPVGRLDAAAYVAPDGDARRPFRVPIVGEVQAPDDCYCRKN